MRAACVVVFGIAVSGCAALPLHPPEAWVEFRGAALGGSTEGYSLDYEVAAVSGRPIWMLVEFDEPTGGRACEFVRKVEPRSRLLFECPMEVLPGRWYSIRLRAFRDDRLRTEVANRSEAFRRSSQQLAEFEVGRAGLKTVRTDLAALIDEGTKDVPSTFEPAWYRPLERPFKVVAFDNSGRLTIDAEAIVFVDGDQTLRIPFSSVTSVRLGEMQGDVANEWVVVRFLDDEGRRDGAGFRDGAYLGHGLATGVLYLAVRRATGR